MTALLFCLVVAIGDGDTITARCGQPGAYEQVKVRIGAIDAPERKQPFGQRSRQALADLCFKQTATIRKTDIDRYGRTVADVECQGKDVAGYMVGAGMAWVYDRYAQGYGHLYPMQDAARTAKRGLWSQEALPPWEWRRIDRRNK